jgi:hypothetical protein
VSGLVVDLVLLGLVAAELDVLRGHGPEDAEADTSPAGAVEPAR